MGGTFDPVHYGHLRSARELKRRLGVEQLRLVPCHIPPHRKTPHCNAEHRWQMLCLALEEFPELQLDKRELERDAVSYSVETLESLREELGQQCSLSLVLGSDAFAGLSQWHRWRDIPALANIVVMARPGWEFPERGDVADLLRDHGVATGDDLLRSPCGSVMAITLLQYDISATTVRGELAVGNLPADWLPPAVLSYIEKHGLYRDAETH
jgi:nicotinate-nucleotide adenylyltransferase